jgi:hypothetical protein
MPIPTALVFVGDLHVGGKHAVSASPHRRYAGQQWLYKSWLNFTKRIATLKRDHSVKLMIGGDLVHVPGDEDAEADALDLLRPLAKGAADVWGVYGTEYHVGPDGNDDKGIYRQLDARCAHHWRLEVAPGHDLDWSHHGMSLGKLPWTELNGHRQLAESVYWRSQQRGRPAPSFIARHHVHVCPDGSPVQHRGSWVSVVPCFCLPDGYAGKVSPGQPPTIGGVIWIPGQRPEIVRYDIPQRFL